MSLFLLTVPLISTSGCSQSSEPEEKSDGLYHLVWSDEFDKDGLPDPSKWAHEVGGNGWGNNELQYYTDKSLTNSRISDSILYIIAQNDGSQGNPYTSARLVTKDKVNLKYGKFEIRAKLPKGKGTWPAIWMLGDNINSAGWPNCGEIDIMEHVGKDQGRVHASIHTDKYNHVEGTQKTANTFLADASTAFHVYGLEWTADSIKISVDNKTYFEFANEKSGVAAWPFDQGCFLILNIAIGGNWGGPVDENIFPVVMAIDYVRVYQKN